MSGNSRTLGQTLLGVQLELTRGGRRSCASVLRLKTAKSKWLQERNRLWTSFGERKVAQVLEGGRSLVL